MFSRPARRSLVPHPLYLPELLVLAWGVFFITKSRDTEPTLKARNFAKVLQRGGSNKRKRRELDSAAAAEASGHDGPRPQDWDSASDDDRNDSGASDSGAIEKVRRETIVVAQFEFAKQPGSGQQEAQATELSPQVPLALIFIVCSTLPQHRAHLFCFLLWFGIHTTTRRARGPADIARTARPDQGVRSPTPYLGVCPSTPNQAVSALR